MICFCPPTVTPVVLATCWLALKDNEGVTMDEGGLDRVRRELAVTLLKGDFPFLSSGQASRKRMSLTKCIMGASLTKDCGPHSLLGIDSIP